MGGKYVYKKGVKYPHNLLIAIHYNTFKIYNIGCGFEVLITGNLLKCRIVICSHILYCKEMAANFFPFFAEV